METYLIQRGKFEDRDYKNGIDSIIVFDYMGSSEFEWGALPKSLGNIRKNIDNYTYLDVPIKDKVITVFCHNDQKADIKEYLTKLADRKMRLKEYSDFDSYINPSEHFNSRTDFWWDIQNDLMFWRKNNEFETKFKLLIINKPA